ncbi:hypothetical protein B0H14DRAFT_2657203 [Mycena olivaceomarginata]|nr:hypothetical protein B0H14DRAFT_2657203 [Mycena olivaceomarginata]
MVVATEGDQWKLAENILAEVKADLTYFRGLFEEVASGDLMDGETHFPLIFDDESLDKGYDTAADARGLFMDARRSILGCMGFLNWWTATVAGWRAGVSNSAYLMIEALQLRSFEKRGFLFSINQDWKSLNFSLLVHAKVPFYYVWGLLSPGVLEDWMRDAKNDLEGLWVGELPLDLPASSPASHYDRFLQLKIDLYAWPRNPLPDMFDDSGTMEPWVIDFQHWKWWLLGGEETVAAGHELYHHVVTQSCSQRVMKIIFQRFMPQPKKELTNENEIHVDPREGPDLEELREHFKGRCAPLYGEMFDLETGVERSKAFNGTTPVDVIHHHENNHLLIHPPGSLGGRYLGHHYIAYKNDEYDSTAIGREVGSRITSPESEHSSERREYDLSELMAHTVGWVAAMAHEDWSDSTDLYVPDKRPHLPTWKGNQPSSGNSEKISIPRLQGKGLLPYPSFNSPSLQVKSTMSELSDRRAGWLNVFADWGQAATYDAYLWRIPAEYSWNPDVLEYGYLLIDEVAEFHLRYQVIINPGIRFGGHLIEVAMEHGIPFDIAYKHTNCDRFRPKPSDEEVTNIVSKAMVDRRSKGPRLQYSPSIKEIYREYRNNLGGLGDTPQLKCLILRGGATSWILRAYLGLVLDPRFRCWCTGKGQTTWAIPIPIDITWDDVSEGDNEAVYGYMPGSTPELDRYLFPTDKMLEEFSDHYYREWNLFCEKTFRHLKSELDGGLGKAMTRGKWKHYF